MAPENPKSPTAIQKIWTFSRHYPIPLFTLCGLILGIVCKFSVENSEAAHWIWFATLALGAIPIIYKTTVGMLRGHFASDIVAMLAIVTAILMDQAFAGAVVVLMQSGGEAIEDFGLRRATSSLEALIARAPREAFRKTDGHIEKIEIGQIRVGDILIVRSGDLVPVDGTIESGTCEIDESALTGEPLARGKGPGDVVYSGSIDVNGSFEMRADKLSTESQYAKIIDLVKKAQMEKAPIQRLADKYAVVFTPLTLGFAAAGYFYTGDPTAILSVLVVATPCPLILATPLAVISGMNKAAELGIIVKGGTPMEQAGQARAVVFDKTGTITYGTPVIEKIVSFQNGGEEDLLRKAAAVEQLSSHSLAKTFVDKALRSGKPLPMPSNPQEIPGRGVKGTVEGKECLVGSFLFLEDELGKGCLATWSGIIERTAAEGNQLVFIAERDRPLGFFVVSDRIRPGTAEMVEHLYSLGIDQVVMLTGDIESNARQIAKEAGIKTVAAELLPEQKLDRIKKIEENEPVIMVGDGINDAPALAAATVGIAMGAHGSGISAEAADIVLLEDDLTKVEETIRVSRRMLYIAKQCIFLGMGLSTLLMIIAAAGKIVPAVGALLQEVIDVVVILNALRAR
jgi:heavy metal translocating P-type ATPase